MRHQKAWITAILVLVSLVAPACGKPDKTGAASLEGTAWVLVSYGPEDSLQPVLADTEVTLEFGAAEEGISGSAGCNHYFGGLTAKGNRLSVSGLGMTEMYCTGPEGVMDQETDYLKALATAETFAIESERLTIACAGGLILVFEGKNP